MFKWLFIITVAVVLFLCLFVFVYFHIYKKNINKALNDGEQSPRKMLEPYKIVYVFVVFLVSFAISVTGIAGLIYSKEYFKYEKDTVENMANRTLYIDSCTENGTYRKVTAGDAEQIKQVLTQKYPGKNISVISVYGVNSGIYMDGRPVNVYAISEEHSSFLGLSDMQKDVAYFYNKEISTAVFDICVTKIVEGGFVSDKIEKLTLDAKNGVSEKSIVTTIQRETMTPSALEEPTCFVTMETFYRIVSVLVESEITATEDFQKAAGIVESRGIYVCVDSLSHISSVASELVKLSYNAYAPEDAFEDFETAISAAFIVFILLSIALVCLSAVNIFITARTIKRAKEQENRYNY